MTEINTILNNNWDIGICIKPTFILLYGSNYMAYHRVFASEPISMNDEIIGLIDRLHFSPESYDAYNCKIASTSESDLKNIIKAVKKVCATFSPNNEENILQWQNLQQRYNHPSLTWFECDIIIFKRKAGIMAY